jgi:16S rRNA (adenine1518-N6/adenine1519-N6)-dimethyltransferase
MQHQMKKKFGQNFLRDKNLLEKIVKSAQIEHKNVIEIGPGQGALTSFLVLYAKSVLAYEVDLTLKPFLKDLENKHENLTILYEDFLKVQLVLDEDTHVVANIPYNLTSPILFKILETDLIKTATIMIQKEVCERLLSKPGSKSYNALSVMMQYYAVSHKVMDVKRTLFYPVPKVDSAVIKIVKREQALLSKDQEEAFIQFLKCAFKQKRKTLLNNLNECSQMDKNHIAEIIRNHNFNENIRAEKLSLHDFLNLFNDWNT